ncbi:MAG TPA: winged helix-turn-helix domain-containing protein [Aliidongia sp.]|uniref:ATP-binding protein n=1 Tax=Aliidongia sp. TaxID=1914230 RepID=UPI002DDD507F|nr:winged helix-turn-helix domain-containing protein [Aliidongia sp.]HEV2673659.1 winged helix-turn-helix domain-containing protein [Aliidongia sp.]
MTAAELCFAFGPFRLLPNRRLLLRGELPVTIGSRGFDILVSLIEHRNALVDKERLKRLVWPNATVADHNLTVHVSSLRKLLDEDGSRYIATVPGRGYRFIAPVEAVAAAPAAPPPAASGNDNLPLPLTRLIGRAADLHQLRATVAESRLVTIAGAGGIGKTHLALEAARQLSGDYPDGIWLVELATTTEPELVPTAIAAALRMEMSRTDGLDGVTRFLRDRRALIVLDNCEHLLEAVARACELILRACPEVGILATSREPLRGEGERVYWLPALAVPLTSEGLTGTAALGYAAIELLIERTRFALGHFDLADGNAPALAEICRRLDGIPLALELAAPLLRVMTAAELAARLDDRFSLLTGGRRTALPRQQTLKAAIDWSYDMLSEAERTLLRRLSIFAGVWTIDAAVSVVAGDPLAPGDIFDLVASLADKSLLTVDLTGAEPLYRLLETTRQYAAEKQAEAGEPDHYAALAQWLVARGYAAERDWQVTGDRPFHARYAADVENLRAALNWCFGAAGDAALGLELVGVAYAHWSARSLFSERRRWLDKAVARLTPATPPGVVARLWYGWSFAFSLNDPAGLEPTLRAAALFREIGDQIGLARALVRGASAAAGSGDLADAEAYLREAEPILAPRGSSRILAVWFRTVGEIGYLAGDFAAARRAFIAGAEIARTIGSPRTLLDIRVSLAELEFSAGSVARAIEIAREALMDFDELPDRYDGMIRATSNLAAYLLAADEFSEARCLSVRSLEAARIQGLHSAYVWMIERCALIVLEQGRPEQAARLLGYTNSFLADKRTGRRPTERYIVERLSSSLHRVLPPAALRHAMDEGALWPRERALAEAQKI